MVSFAMPSPQSQPNPADVSKMQTLTDQEQSRIQAYKAARDAYNGVFVDQVQRRVGDITSDLVRVNRIKPIVSATVNFLFGQAPSWELPAEVDGEEVEGEDSMSQQEEWLAECLRVNRWEALLLDLGIDGALCGTPYIGIDLSNLIPNPKNPIRAFPRLHVLDPADMTIKWSPRDISSVTAYIWQYNTWDPEKKQPMTVRRRVELGEDGKWLITDQHSYSANMIYMGEWITDGAPVRWPFEWPPIIHCKNLPCPNEVYGDPDVSATIIALNKARNFNLSNWSRIVRKHAQPKPWVKGMMGKRIELDSEVIDMPSEKAEIGQLTPVVDGASSETLGRVIDEAICEESQTPSLVLGRPDQQGIPSGTALRIKLWPLVNKTETKRTLYGPMLIELMRRLMEAGGWGPNNVVSLKWPEALPTDPKTEREVIQLDLSMGLVSKQTASQKLGYDYENELENMAQEQQAASPAMPQGQGQAAGTPGAASTGGPAKSQAQIEQQMQSRVQSYLTEKVGQVAVTVGGGAS